MPIKLFIDKSAVFFVSSRPFWKGDWGEGKERKAAG